MTTGQPPKVRKFLWLELVRKTDPDVFSTKELDYRFSNGRKFYSNKSRNRTT